MQYKMMYHSLVERLHCKHVSTPNEQFPFVLPIILQPESDDQPLSIVHKQFQVNQVHPV